MSESPHSMDRTGELPTRALVAMIAFCWAAMVLGLHSWRLTGLVLTIRAVLSDGMAAVVVALAAGGYGRLVSRAIRPAGAPPVLSAASAVVLGLWLLSAGVLAGGSLGAWGLSGWLWWPVMAVGAVVGLAQLHRPLGRLVVPKVLSGSALVWVLAAAAAALWLSGAKTPAGQLGNLSMDSHEVLSGTLQVPREFLLNGRVGVLEHNVHSRGVLGVEMLFLLGMILRGGAYEGMILAKLLVGLFGVAAVAGAFAETRRAGDLRARGTAALLATAPWVLYLSWIALPDLAAMGSLVLTLAWLRRWMDDGQPRSAVWAGLMAGVACAASFDGLLMAAGPVLLVMLAAGLLRGVRGGTVASTATPPFRGGLLGVGAAAAGIVVMFAPWAIRSAIVNGGNPVFPHAVEVLGAGPWRDDSGGLDEHGRRWVAAHSFLSEQPASSTRRPASAGGYQQPASGAGSTKQPPPEGGGPDEGSAEPTGLRRYLAGAFLLNAPPYNLWPALGAGVLAVLVGTLLSLFIRPRAAEGWDWALLGVLAIQAAAWIALSGAMPARTAALCVGPISLLCAGGLARLARVKTLPWLKQAAAAGTWGLAPAVVLLVGSAAINLVGSWAYFRDPYQLRLAYPMDTPASTMLVGESRAFYFPHGTVYATVYDEHPLERILPEVRSSDELAARLRGRGITDVLVNWSGMEYLARTAGWPEAMAPGEIERLMGSWQVVREEWYPPPAATTQPATSISEPATPASLPATPAFRRGLSTTATAPTVEPRRILTIYRVPDGR